LSGAHAVPAGNKPGGLLLWGFRTRKSVASRPPVAALPCRAVRSRSAGGDRAGDAHDGLRPSLFDRMYVRCLGGCGGPSPVLSPIAET
jgi:hypothetical protein